MGLKFREPGLAASGKPAKVKGSEKKSGVKAAGITKSVTKRKPTDGLASAVKAVTGAAKPAKKGAAPASKPAPAAATAAPGKGKPAARDEAPLKRKQAQAEEAFGTSSSSDDNESDFEAGSDAEMEDTHASGRSEPASERPTSGASAGALSSFRLSPQTVDALAGRGITSLFAIQAATFDIIFDGADLIGRAHTGMGKTLAFALPTIERILILKRSDRSLPRPMKPLALILAPTRELAQQVGREIAAVAPALACACVYGGAPIGQQCSDLRRGIDILIGTPGRVKDLANRGALELDDVRLATLDEADQMLDMGFAEDMADILGRCTHADRQTCLFSATLPPWVVQEAPKYMR
jgi:ATP-dependent RNA helicase DDX21